MRDNNLLRNRLHSVPVHLFLNTSSSSSSSSAAAAAAAAAAGDALVFDGQPLHPIVLPHSLLLRRFPHPIPFNSFFWCQEFCWKEERLRERQNRWQVETFTRVLLLQAIELG